MYKNDIEICTADANNGLYILNINQSQTCNMTNKRLKLSNKDEIYMCHCRMGHIKKTRISTLSKSGYLDEFDPNSYNVCESCLLGKMPKTPFSGKGTSTTELLALVHSDVYGPMSSQVRGGYEYFVTFTDDASRYGYVYLMRH